MIPGKEHIPHSATKLQMLRCQILSSGAINPQLSSPLLTPVPACKLMFLQQQNFCISSCWFPSRRLMDLEIQSLSFRSRPLGRASNSGCDRLLPYGLGARIWWPQATPNSNHVPRFLRASSQVALCCCLELRGPYLGGLALGFLWPEIPRGRRVRQSREPSGTRSMPDET